MDNNYLSLSDRLTKLDNNFISAVNLRTIEDLSTLGLFYDKNNLIFHNGERYSLKPKECDGFKMDEHVYEVYGTLDKFDDDEMNINSVIVKEITKSNGTLYTLSRNDCEWLGIEFSSGLQLLPKSLDWKYVDVDFDENDLSTTQSLEGDGKIHYVLLKINGFKSYPNSNILTPSGKIIDENRLENSLVIRNNIPLISSNHKIGDSNSTLLRKIVKVGKNKYTNSNILTDDNELYVLVRISLRYRFNNDYGIDRDYLKNISPKDFFSVEWDEFGAMTLNEYNKKIEFERYERERRIAIEEEKIKKRREKEELLRKEAIKAKEEIMKKKKKQFNDYISSISSSISSISPNRIYREMNSDILGVNSRISDLDNISDNIIKAFDDTERLINTCISDIDIMSDKISRYGDKYKLLII